MKLSSQIIPIRRRGIKLCNGNRGCVIGAMNHDEVARSNTPETQKLEIKPLPEKGPPSPPEMRHCAHALETKQRQSPSAEEVVPSVPTSFGSPPSKPPPFPQDGCNARVFLRMLKKCQHEKTALDPREAKSHF